MLWLPTFDRRLRGEGIPTNVLLWTLKVTGESDAGGTSRLVCTSGRNILLQWAVERDSGEEDAVGAGGRRRRDSGEKKRVMMTEMTNCKMIDRTTCTFVRGIRGRS